MQGLSLEHLLSALDIHVRSVGICEIGEGVRLFQRPMEEIVVHHILQGQGWLDVEGADPVPFHAGTVLVVPRGRCKRIGVHAGSGEEVEATSLCRWSDDDLFLVDATGGAPLAIRMACQILSPRHASSLGLFDNLIAPLSEDLSGVTMARAAFGVVLNECANRRFGSRALIETTVRQCLILALRQHYDDHGPQSQLFGPYRDPRLVRVAGAIVQSPGGPHSVAALAASVNMSRSAFVKRFSECFGRSPMDFVSAVRLETAARLLLSSQLPVKTMASIVGFASRSHFSRAFRARYGVNPSLYRRNASQGATTRFRY
jgi:AraC-like DNA-binding protein